MKFSIPSANRYSSGIYILTDTATNDSYIGSTRNFWVRFRAYRSIFKTGKIEMPLLLAHVQKHGVGNLEMKALEICSPHQINGKEYNFIALLNPTLNKNRGEIMKAIRLTQKAA